VLNEAAAFIHDRTRPTIDDEHKQQAIVHDAFVNALGTGEEETLLLARLIASCLDYYEPGNSSEISLADLPEPVVKPAHQDTAADLTQLAMSSKNERKRQKQKKQKQRAKKRAKASNAPVQPDDGTGDDQSTIEATKSLENISLENPDEDATDTIHDDRLEPQHTASDSLQLPPASVHPTPLTPVAEEDESDTTPTKSSNIEHPSAITNGEPAPVGSQSPVPSTTSSGPSEATAVPSVSESSLATAVPSPKSARFSFDNYHPETRCRNPDCRKSTHPLDGNTKICPACGPRSMVRYCSKSCLYKDVRRHFFGECGQLSIRGEIDEASLSDANNNVRPYLRHTSSITKTVEHHRQAVWYAMEAEGEYFIFNDVEECGDILNTREPTKEEYQEVRGKGNCVFTVSPPEAVKQQFRTALITAMTFGPDNVGNMAQCELMVGFIITALQAYGDWNAQMCDYLCAQIGFEIGYQVPPHWQIWQ
jgi:hypothetical protein